MSAVANGRFTSLERHVPALRRTAVHLAALPLLPAVVVAVLAHAALNWLIPDHVSLAPLVWARDARAFIRIVEVADSAVDSDANFSIHVPVGACRAKTSALFL